MLNHLRQAFGDPSRDSLVTLAKATLRSPNAPLQEQAAAIERLAVEGDAESKSLVVSFAAGSIRHVWLQQVAGEAVASMLQTGALRVEDIASLSAVASETVIAILRGEEDQDTKALLSRVETILGA